MRKNLLSFIVLIILGIITFSGCSIDRKIADHNFVTVTLSGWSNLNEKQLLQQVLHDFEVKNPKIKVKYEVIADQYMDVLKTRLIGDTAADVFYLDALEAPALMSPDILEPLDNYITPKFDIKDFEPILLNAFQQNGKIYGLPKDFSTLALFYNKKVFETANLSQPPQTWEQLRQYSKKLTIDTNKDNRIEQYGFGIAPELARQYFMIKAFGGELINSQEKPVFASSESLKGLQLIIDQYRQDKSAAQPTDVGTTSGSEIFGQSKAAMLIEGTWLIPYLKQTFPKLEYATAEVPTVAGKKGTMAYTVAYVMNKQSKHKSEAWQLISYLTGKEGMKAWTSGGFALPTRKSVAAALGYDKNRIYSPFITGATYATIWQAGKNLPIILTNFNNQFISAMLGEQTLKSAMTKAQETVNKEIKLAE